MKKIISKLLSLSVLSVSLMLTTTCIKLEKSMLVSTGEVTNISATSADAAGEIIDLGELAVQHGHYYGKSPNLTTSDLKTQLGQPSAIGGFTSQLSDLETSTKYYIKAYINDGTETVFGTEKSFTTGAASAPVVTTTSISDITSTSASSGGNITNDGGSPVTARGVCWNTSAGPTINDIVSDDGTGSGSFTSSLTSLSPNTTYYVRAYATNSIGTDYGDEISFKTDAAASTPPTAAAAAATVLTNTTATLNGAVNANGSNTIVTFEYGTTIIYGSSVTANQSPVTGTIATTVDAQLTGLTAGTLYHFRVKAVSAEGTSYSDDLSFTTLQLPLTTTEPVTNITPYTATLNGIVNAANLSTTVTFEYGPSASYGSTVIATPNPVTGEIQTNVSAGITGLDCNTTYYVRAYSTNSSGTAYGNQVSFTTNQCPVAPTVTTSPVGNIASTSVQSGGNVTDNGGAIVTVRGVCWSTTENPTITSSDFLTEGSGVGNFSIPITGLTRYTTYYLRAFATNSAGTGYGEEISFKTLWDNSNIADIDGNVYKTIQIGDQIWMAENLKVTRFSNGNPITLVTSTAEWDAFTYANADKAYCYYDNSTLNLSIYGALYTWAAALNGNSGSDNNPSGIQGVCPTGWHIPGDQEWKVMESYLGMNPSVLNDFGSRGTDEGGKLKEAGTVHWYTPNTGATNETGFTALPGGERTSTGSFTGKTTSAYFWTTAPDLVNSNNAITRSLNWGTSTVYRSSQNKLYGISVRCVKN